ncbi:choice-of-anchor K domain-containing protein [Nostoc sp. CHAB 5824]|nr:choice-of-anchor K domain-containing protein [Nostoc sp. CHAB 5824]
MRKWSLIVVGLFLVLSGQFAWAQTPTLFQGTASARFINPVPSTAVITGVGTSSIAWGTPIGTPPSSLNFGASSGYRVNEDEVFSLGNLTFFNGTIQLGTEINSIDFEVTAHITNPSGVGSQAYTFRFSIINSPNTGNPIGDSDSVFLPSGFFSQIFTTPDGSQFTLELVGFGTVTGSGFSTIDQFFVQESASASAQLLARFVRVPDLRATAFEYRVPIVRDELELNSPVAVNVPYVVTATVENRGQGRAGSFTATVYLSSDNVIDPERDFPLQSVTVAGLAPGAPPMTLTINMQPPTTWPDTLPRWSGVVTIGLVIDPQRRLPDGDFTNNQNRGIGTDTRPLQLYDAVPPVSDPVDGLNYRQALLWMFRNGFHPIELPGPIPDIVGSGWSKWLSPSLNIRSPLDGKIRNGTAYRQNAFIQERPRGSGNYRIRLQGTATFGEPNPETAVFFLWPFYVYDWHERY